ncbi:hypothetical protein K438DRAFT_2109212 [Mycena galopus ATCC 62051]|nr:hypothetical protein K438DRAFT_2109212 [Mycena galopus ATCC 62051]
MDTVARPQQPKKCNVMWQLFVKGRKGSRTIINPFLAQGPVSARRHRACLLDGVGGVMDEYRRIWQRTRLGSLPASFQLVVALFKNLHMHNVPCSDSNRRKGGEHLFHNGGVGHSPDDSRPFTSGTIPPSSATSDPSSAIITHSPSSISKSHGIEYVPTSVGSTLGTQTATPPASRNLRINLIITIVVLLALILIALAIILFLYLRRRRRLAAERPRDTVGTTIYPFANATPVVQMASTGTGSTAPPPRRQSLVNELRPARAKDTRLESLQTRATLFGSPTTTRGEALRRALLRPLLPISTRLSVSAGNGLFTNLPQTAEEYVEPMATRVDGPVAQTSSAVSPGPDSDADEHPPEYTPDQR